DAAAGRDTRRAPTQWARNPDHADRPGHTADAATAPRHSERTRNTADARAARRPTRATDRRNGDAPRGPARPDGSPDAARRRADDAGAAGRRDAGPEGRHVPADRRTDD